VQLDGTLATFPLRELIEMIVYSSVTGVLELRANMEVGQIFFRDGQPYHAILGDRSGNDAITAMFEERDAPFRFVADREATGATLWMDPWELIERGEEQARKWASVRAHIPNVECVPTLSGTPSEGHIQISETIWPVLAVVDGQRSVREIAEHLNWVLLDACVAIMGLIDRGLIAIHPPRSAAHQPAGPAPAFPAPATSASPAKAATGKGDGNGFLERMLAEAQAKERQRPNLTDDEAQEPKRAYRYVDDRR
jgi:hypothetical protein